MKREEIENAWRALNRIEIKPGVQNAMNLVAVADFLMEASSRTGCEKCKDKEEEDGSINR